MKRFFRVLFRLDPPMGKWIWYQDYVLNWRDEWKDKVKIIAHHPQRPMIKLALLDLKNEADKTC
jgi:hypothetical protein